MKFEVTVTNQDQLSSFAAAIASRLRGGEVIELIGDVGAGKTTFTRFLVKALDSPDHVSSPTFAISNIYEDGRLPVHHFDFYRLGDNDSLIKHELAEVLELPDAVIVMEWAKPLKTVLDKEPITLRLQAVSEEARRITVTIPEHYSYIGGSA